MKKCKLGEDGFFNWCSAMEKMLYPEANAKVKGFVQVNVYNIKTDKTYCRGVVYRDSGANECNKIMLNVCPFCGEEILNYKNIKNKVGDIN